MSNNNNFIIVEKHYIPRDIYLQLYSPYNTPVNELINRSYNTTQTDLLQRPANIFSTSTTNSTNNTTNNNTTNNTNSTNTDATTTTNTTNAANTPLPETSQNFRTTNMRTSNISGFSGFSGFGGFGGFSNGSNSSNSNNSNGNINISATLFSSSRSDLFPMLDLRSNLMDIFNNLGINAVDTESFTISTNSFTNDFEVNGEDEDDEDIIISAGDLCEISCIDLWRNFEKDANTNLNLNLTDEIIDGESVENIEGNIEGNIENKENKENKENSELNGDNREKNRESCPICKVEFEELDICRQITSCRHIFHCVCLDMWLQHNITCPMCRHNLHGDIVLSSRESL